jgi:NAD(P)-dependent dehydrogenase (short-subunit alcohol dehydrogenase family)
VYRFRTERDGRARRASLSGTAITYDVKGGLMDFSGKVSLVTGAGSGIGRATAIRLAQEGSRVVITDVDAGRLDEAQAAIEADGGEVLSRRAELASIEAIRELVSACEERFGALHVLVNNAGTHSGGPVESFSSQEWDRVHAVNAKAPFFLVQSALELLKASGGAVVNVSSMSGILGMDSMSVYCSSKGALVALTRALAHDLAPFRIRVNCVCPGPTDTAQPATFLAAFSGAEQARLKEHWYDRLLMKRSASSEEIANAVVYLASDEASFSTGLIMPVDGGYAAW